MQIDNTAKEPYRLNASLHELKKLLLQNGVNPSDAAPISISLFSDLDNSQQQLILKNISTYLQVLSADILPENDRSTLNVEINRLKKALRAFGLKAYDDNVFNLITEDDIIEIYSADGRQLYRNILFCKMCSYSLLDLAVNSWDQLYEKPAQVTNQILELIKQILTTNISTTPYNLDAFIQREKFIYAKTLRTYIVTPRYISPLLDAHSGERIAMLSTYSAQILAEGSASLKFDII